MATIGFEPGVAPRRDVAPLERVAADMRAIFGGAPSGARPVRRAFRARVRAAAAEPVVVRRSAWRRAGAVLLAGGGAGALLGWWVLAAPQDMRRETPPRAPAHVARAVGPTAAPVTPSVLPPVDTVASAASPAPIAGSRNRAAPPAGAALPQEATAPPSAYAAMAVPVPERAELAPLPQAIPSLPRFEQRLAEGDCARHADACTFADVGEAELQVREAYAAAASAGADPRDLIAVRRRWARLQAIDGGRPDRLVTDYARLAGRLGWLADAAAGADDGPE